MWPSLKSRVYNYNQNGVISCFQNNFFSTVMKKSIEQKIYTELLCFFLPPYEYKKAFLRVLSKNYFGKMLI